MMVPTGSKGALHESELIGVAPLLGSQQGWKGHEAYATRQMPLGGSVGGPRVGAALCLGQLDADSGRASSASDSRALEVGFESGRV
jgi:hypothetical protein